ncbi:MAG TPA: peptide-methionine (S)-S-oxide reductase MsrA [Polyangiaceae bacterium]|nr:peptide-methionine (S)-S-oxide reductase MsrA [Polyangiaceae bacterium]
MRTLLMMCLVAGCHGVGSQPIATSESSAPVPTATPGKVGGDPGHATATGGKLTPVGSDKLAAFAAGCFWGVEDAFRHVPGVVATAPGYSGGHTENPTYEDVCTHTTGHAETVLVEFDPAKVSYDKLLQAFWMMHDPTQVNRQGPDFGDNYRSVVFTFDDEQARVAKASKEKEQPKHDKPIATSIEPMRVFYKAEAFHQQYSERTGDHSCPINLKLESL